MAPVNGALTYHPAFDVECRKCGNSPCVIVYDQELRSNSETELCGCCFFNNRMMIDWSLWNDPQEATE